MSPRSRPALLLAVALLASASAPAVPRATGQAPPLPLPRTLPLDAYERLLYRFLEERQYAGLPGWGRDKTVRDTGPWIAAAYYGTHPAVRSFYSPEVVAWLAGGRAGPIPDGAIIVKEMFPPPAARYEGQRPDQLDQQVGVWTVMVRDRAGSRDGWFWSYYEKGQPVDTDAYPFDYPNSGFGQYCVRCHASAEREGTFAASRNLEGQPGDPLVYRVDDSWRPSAAGKTFAHRELAAGPDEAALRASKPVRDLDPEFVRVFASIPPVTPERVVPFPPVTYDHVLSGPRGPAQFMTSDQCLPCHSGQPGPPFGPNMFIPGDGKRPDVNLSPYGEWSWSMMGLAGRDPIFYAQLESELALYPGRAAEIQGLCFRCHGVMGQRQLAIDRPDAVFREDLVYGRDRGSPDFRYAALARDGVSCAVCHQIVDDRRPLDDIFTGRFEVSRAGQFEPGVANIYGPFDRPATHPMLEALGLKPVQSDYVRSARLCASCHAIHLPIFDKDGHQVGSDFEQATYLEWLNSSFRTELGTGPTPKTCQNCHMPDRHAGQPLAFRIANVLDRTYPETDGRASLAALDVPIRDGFRRHTLLGLNQFALEMFRQFDDVLGVRKTDYMSGSDDGLPAAIAESDRLAREETARVELASVERAGRRLTVRVRVTNLTGHRFPSGVGFRRAFLELRVVDDRNAVVWGSGRTNGLGIIVDADGRPLPSEFFEVDPRTGQQAYQPHHRTITRQDQVQIYQELAKNPEGRFTTSFLALQTTVKDNRLLPRGWTRHGPPGFLPAWAEATAPHGDAAHDPDFTDGSGLDLVTYEVELPPGFGTGTVAVAIYYQAIPPAYLRDRFTTAAGRDTQRLHYLASRLNLDGTNVRGWKLLVQSATGAVPSR